MNSLLKIALQFTQPLCLIWLLLGVWLLRLLWKRIKGSLWLPAISWVLLTVISCTPLASILLASLENQIPKVQLNELSDADAILCLGGGVEPSLSEPTGFHLKIGADRLSTALTLAVAGKAPLLILGGGGYPHEGRTLSEADAVRDYLAAYVPLKIELNSLGICSDTHDEALKVAALMRQRGLKRLLLVTSASHMPRAIGVFRKTEVQVIPVPCNYHSSLNHLGDLDWLHLPSYHGFEIFASWMHEVIGHYVYLWRGWI
ncbi:MAG: YdcF family protein [Prosthecobacter sp.]